MVPGSDEALEPRLKCLHHSLSARFVCPDRPTIGINIVAAAIISFRDIQQNESRLTLNPCDCGARKSIQRDLRHVFLKVCGNGQAVEFEAHAMILVPSASASKSQITMAVPAQISRGADH